MNFHEDARRITACINACAGISTEALEESARSGQRVSEMLLKQRDELLRICHNVVERGIGASDVAAMRAVIERCKP